MDQPRTSLRDIARELGVSHATVSLALRNHPKISAPTRQRVHETALRLGYRPDPMLTALVEYRRGKKSPSYQATLGWIDNYPLPNRMEAHRGFALYRKGAEARAAQLGYAVEPFYPVYQKLTESQLRRIFITRNIKGLLVAPQPVPNTRWDFDLEGFSAVTFGFSLVSPRLHLVTNSQAESCVLALRKLRELGHKKVGLILRRDFDDRTGHNFLGGFVAEHVAVDALAPVLLFSQRLSRAEFQRWMTLHKPTAIILDSLGAAGDIRSWVSIPRQLSLAVLGAGADPFWACIDQNDEHIGRVAIDTLVGMLHCNETGVPALPHRLLVEGTWREGASVAEVNRTVRKKPASARERRKRPSKV